MKCSHAACCVLLVTSQVASVVCSGLGTTSPVEKIVTLLRDLKTRVEEDGKAEQQTYDKYACWCETTTDQKASSITKAQDDLRSLGQSILKLKGTVATRMSEIAELTTSIKANEEAQAELTSIRQKENAAYMAETAEMKEALDALAKAVTVLKHATKASFLQQGSACSMAVRRVVEALPSSALNAKAEQLALLRAFVSGHASAHYAPQSLTVQGILSDMFATFSADLQMTTEAEGTKNRQFEELMTQKQAQLKEMQKQMQKKEQEKAEAEVMLADSTASYDNTEAQLKADVVFFDKTKAACETKHSAWVERSALRAEELQGITKALEILSSDDARSLFASAIKPGKETGVDTSYDANVSLSFLQLGDAGAPASKAYAALRASATRTRSLRLAALAARLREAKVGHFDQVLAAIDKMMATLTEEGAEDIKKRDQCLEEYQKINSTVADVNWKIKKNGLAIEKLELLIEDLRQEKTETVQAISDTSKEIADMKKQRQGENAAFLQAKAEDQQAIGLLKQAKDVLSAYYTNHSVQLGPMQGMALTQQGPTFEVSADQAPEATFSDKDSRKYESKGILQILTMIMEDLRDEIRNGMKAEELAQLDFEEQLKAAEDLEAQLQKKKVDLESAIAKRTQDKDDEDADMTKNKGDLKSEEDYRGKIRPDCDWIIGAFEKRASSRAAEMDGLVSAKEFLAGYEPQEAAFLARTPAAAAFDDDTLPRIDFLGLRH